MIQSAKKNGGMRLLQRDVHITRLLFLMAGWMIFMAIFRFDKFYSVISFQTMGSQFPEFGLMSLGVMLCMITGGIDLSVVGIANFTSITAALLIKSLVLEDGSLPFYCIPLVFIVGAAVGALAGIFNGLLVSKVHIPPILATLGSFELFKGIAIVMTKGKAVSGIPLAYAEAIAGKTFGVIPTQLVIFLLVSLFVWFLLAKTTYGTKLYMLGTSQTVARFSGLDNDRLTIQTFMLSGICAALGGLIMLANYNSARADYGAVYTLQCVLIVVLGGVSPAGGRGKIGGVLLAIVVLQMLQSGLNRFPHISSFYIPLIWGSVLLLIMVLNYFTDHPIRRAAKR